MWLKDKAEDLGAEPELPTLEFWNGFLHGHIIPFRHRQYIRAAALTLARPENRDRGLLEVATSFADSLFDFKQRNSQLQLLPESRTKTVFWLYQVKFALESLWKTKAYGNSSEAPPLPVIISHAPELLNEKLLEEYYPFKFLQSDEAHGYWMLPPLKPLPEHPNMPKPISFAGFGNKTSKDLTDFHLERYLRFALVVVQRYLRPGETRRRSWFIKLAFESIQRQIMQLRRRDSPALDESIPIYSETQAYFYLQLVHAALSQLPSTGKEDMIQSMTYHSFQQLFAIKPSVWKKHYSPKVWDSLQSRGRFSPPDLKPLPNTMPPTSVIESNLMKQASLLADPNEPFHKLGLIPELPPLEVIYFNLAIFLEDVKTVALPISPSSESGIPTDAHLLKYVHSYVIRSGTTDTIPARAKRALNLLSRNPSLNVTRTTFLLNLALSVAPGIGLAYPDQFPENLDYNPPPLPDFPRLGYSCVRVDNRTSPPTRYHNCPCHADVPMPGNAGGGGAEAEAIEYPGITYAGSLEEWKRRPIYHGCVCHGTLLVDQNKLAAVMAARYGQLEDDRKTPSGTNWGGGDQNGWKEDDGFAKWVRSNLVLVCGDEVGKGYYVGKGKEWGGEEGKRTWVRFDGGAAAGVEGKKHRRFFVLVEPGEGEGEEEEQDGGEDDTTTTGLEGAIAEVGIGEERDEDAKTLAGGKEGEDEEEDWEAVSQTGTLC